MWTELLGIAIAHAGMGGLSNVKRHGHDPQPVPPEIADLVGALEAF